MGTSKTVGRVLSTLGGWLNEEEEITTIRPLLTRHFGQDPSQLPVLEKRFQTADLPNLHLALEAFIKAPGRRSQTHGVCDDYGRTDAGLAQLASASRRRENSTHIGPVSYVNVTLADEETMACVRAALFLVHDGQQPLAILQSYSERSSSSGLAVEVMGRDRASAGAALAHLRTSMRQQNVYRGRVISLGLEGGQLKVSFHRLPSIDREQVILPAEVLNRIERQTFAFSRHREQLLRSGRHIKRGLLLHGPPGTGKTFTAMYLASQMRDRTTLIVTGRQQGLIGPICTMARLLQPATILIEDIDLIAEDRRSEHASTVVLFDLLNEMDGLRPDADVLFVLTTNRPEVLEPALAARPGRVDMAIEVPLPDADCRRRLIASYGEGLALALSRTDWLIDRTEGVSAAFLKELLRHAALVAADAGSDEVNDSHLEEALRELLTNRDQLTRSLLGASRATAAAV